MLKMSNFQCDVLCPSGHRVTYKGNQNDSMLQIKSHACQKRKLDLKLHKLVFQDRGLSDDAIIRYSNLPNRCTLEMVALDPTASSSSSNISSLAGPSANVAVSYNGKRQAARFSTATSLRDVLTELGLPLSSVEANQQPSLVYLRHEVAGIDALQATRLQDIGITGSSASLRYSFRDPSAPQIQTTSSSAGELKNVPAKKLREKSPPRRPMRVNPDASISDLIQKEKQRRRSRAQDEETCMPAEEQPENENAHVSPEAPPGAPPENLPEDLSSTKEEEKPAFEEPRAVENKENVEAAVPVPEEPTANEDGETSAAAVPEKPQYHFIEQTHESLIYIVGNTPIKKRIELSDDFYEPTEKDFRARHAELKRQVNELENRELLTKKQRDKQAMEAKQSIQNKYRKCVLRIRLQGQYVVQAVFMVHDTIQTVKTFLKTHFIVDNIDDFKITTQGTNSPFENDQTLSDAEMVPFANVVYSGPKPDPFFRPGVLEKLSTFVGAMQALNQVTVTRSTTTSVTPSQEAYPSFSSQEASQSFSSQEASSSSSATNSGRKRQQYTKPSLGEGARSTKVVSSTKIPAWFKRGKQ